MAPAEVSELASTPAATFPLRHLKTINRAMELPVVSDTVGEVAKYANTIRSNSIVQSATNAVHAGFMTIADFRAVVAVKDAVLNSTTVSDVLLPRMTGAVESLDSLAASQLDNLKKAVPAIGEPTPHLIQTTKEAASGYWARALDYLSSFTIAQVSLGLADKSLDLAASMVCKVEQGVQATPALENLDAAKTSASLLNRLQENIGGVREVVQGLKKRGEPGATDLAAKVSLLLSYLHLGNFLRYLGLTFQAKEVEKEEEEEKVAAEPAGEVETITTQHQQTTVKRGADTDSSDDDDD
jgi:hypothetical protein